jgi:OmpA-OmpF porin, OOP family
LFLPVQSRQLSDRVSPLDSYVLPSGPFEAGKVPGRMFEGRIEKQSWRLDGAAVTTLQVLTPLRDQILAEGYDILLDCRDQACGGFDFRFETSVIPAPDMHVNIRDYRFLSAVRGEDEALSLLVSRAGNAVYIQAIYASPPGAKALRIIPTDRPEPQVQPRQSGELANALEAEGYVILTDLVFETGSAQLGEGPFTSLAQLAGFLKENPKYRIALVGHTDSTGSLENNISLSRSRAMSVRTRMIQAHSVAPERIDAEGMGYLAPVASNLTVEGRKANRRVEAILLSR